MNKLSPEQLRQLANTISEAKGLTDRQAEIIEQVLAGEADIGKLRISYLKEYFDTYSKGLDQVARKHSQLNDNFLILERQVKNSQAQLNNANRLVTDNSSSAGGGGSSGGAGGGSSSSSGKKKGKKVSNADHSNMSGADMSGVTEAQLEESARQCEAAIRRLDELAEFNKKNEEERENAILAIRTKNDEFEAARDAERVRRYGEIAEDQKAMEQALVKLHNKQHQDKVDKEISITALRLSNVQKVIKAETGAQDLLNNFEAERILAENHGDESDTMQERLADAARLNAGIKKLEDERTAYIKKRELELYHQNGKALEKADYARIRREAADKFKIDKENAKKLGAEQEALDKKRAIEQEINAGLSKLADKNAPISERIQAFKDLTQDSDGNFDGKKAGAAMVKAAESGIKMISDFAQQLEANIDSIASYKSIIDTRLLGSSAEKYKGSYWDQLVRDMTSVGAVNPYFKQENFAKNIEALVSKGIAFDLKQRAFLMTIQEKIANTFDATNSTLLRLVRIQQEDSTAGRLGMEASLNAFLNRMYETSEYLSNIAGSVRDSLQEMEALMSGAEATEVEYQVQKWLGSLYSVGMSDSATQSIATALGQIAAGQIEGLTSGGASNLLIMAANDAGLSIADILTEGINSSDTNKLLQAVVNYLDELAQSSKDNNVVQQQLANVFGVKASDLRAATNIVSKGSTSSIYGHNQSYSSMLNVLSAMAGTMGQRTSLGEMLTNVWENGKYTLAGGIASNPSMYLIYKLAKMLDSTVGGIDLPFINAFGTGVDLNTSVSELMRLGAVGGGILGSLGPMFTGLGNSFDGRKMLAQLGIDSGSGLAVTPRGTSGAINGAITRGMTTSSSGYVGNASGSDIKDSTIQESEDSKKQLMIEAKEEEEANQINSLNNTVLKIYELLDDVVHGTGAVRVKVEGYGLTKSSSSSSSLGGVGALSNNSSSGSSNSMSGGVNSSSTSGSLSLGGWTVK